MRWVCVVCCSTIVALAGCQLGDRGRVITWRESNGKTNVTTAADGNLIAKNSPTDAVYRLPQVSENSDVGRTASGTVSLATADANSKFAVHQASHASSTAPAQPSTSAPSRPQSVSIPEPLPNPPTAQPPDGPFVQLALFDAVELALAQNPDLETLRQAEGVSVGALGVAQTYPFNPWVQVQATPIQRNTAGGSGAVGHYVLLMQTIQLAHQRRHREDNAMSLLSSVRWNIVQAELQNVAQTQRLFCTALYQRGLYELAREMADWNKQLLTIAERQLSAGQISAADAAIVRLDAQSTRQQMRLAEANYRTATLDLRRHLNLPLATPLDVNGRLSDWLWMPSVGVDACRHDAALNALAALTPIDQAAHFAATRPDVMAAQADLAAARAGENLARANRVPDLQIGPYFQRDDFATQFIGFRAQSDIPVWNNGKPLVRQRMAEVYQRSVAWEQVLARATREAEAALDRYERARRLATEDVSSDALPPELQRLEAQFNANEVDLLRLFQARTSLLQLRRARLDSLNELAQAAATVTAATGLPPQTLIENVQKGSE